MADAMIEKRPGSGIIWWPFVLLGFALALIVTLVLVYGDRPAKPYVAQPAKGGVPAEGPITDLRAIVGLENRLPLVGREVDLPSAEVFDVVGDKTFLVGPSALQSAIVVFDPPADSPPPQKIGADDSLAIRGKLRVIPPDQTTRVNWNLDRLRPSELVRQQVLIYTTQAVKKLDR